MRKSYNRKLKRLFAIDLKLGNFRHKYKRQMELYLPWFAKYYQESDEQPPLGIILCAGNKQSSDRIAITTGLTQSRECHTERNGV